MSTATAARQRFVHRDVDLVACAVLALIGLVAFWVGIRPVFNVEDEQRRLQDQLTQSRRQLAAAQTEYNQVRKTIESTRERLSRSMVVLHTAEGLALRQEEVSRTVLDGGIRLEQLMVGAAVPGELLDAIPLHLTGSGPFPRVVSIMHELRTRFPDMAITSFQISGGAAVKSGSENEPAVHFILDIAWYTARSAPSRS